MLFIKQEREGEKFTVTLGGRLDFNGSSQLEYDLKRALKGINTLVFDLRDLEYISSSGLRVLLSAYKQMSGRGSMRLINVGEPVIRTIEIKGLDEIFAVSGHDRESQAVSGDR